MKKMDIVNAMNKAIESVSLEKFENLGAYTNLKMYDASFKSCDLENGDKYFQEWCEMIYQHEFLEMENEKNVKRDYIGRTSSFCFVSDTINHDLQYTQEYGKSTNEEKRLMIFEEYLFQECNITLNCCDTLNGKIVDISDIDYSMENYEMSYEEAIEEYMESTGDLDNFEQDFNEFCDNLLDDSNFMYEWLEKFKENQVAYFMEWYNDTKEWEKQEQE